MKKIQTSRLKPGMKAAQPIITKRGQVIAKEGTILTSQLIARLSFYRIETIHIEEEDSSIDTGNKVVSELKETETKKSTVNTATKQEPKASPQDQLDDDSILKSQRAYTQKLLVSPEYQKFQKDYTSNVESLRKQFDDIIGGSDVSSTSDLLKETEELFRSKTSLELFDIIHSMRANDDSVFAHSLNVALISRAMGKWLQLSKEDLDVLTLSGLLHDIGKSKIPSEILNKPGKYTDEEFNTMRSHPLIGYKLLRGKGFDKRILLVTTQHHERQDGTGYPRGLQADEIDDFSSIVAIADVYDAMTAARPHRAPFCAFQVIDAFEKEGLQKFHTQFILTFLKRVASCYQNSRVLLSDGRSARVVYLNDRCLSRPMVELDDKTIIDLSQNHSLTIQSIL